MAETVNEAPKKYDNHMLRIICILLVMIVPIVHYAPPDLKVGGYPVWSLIHTVGRFAMPIFFMVSGYFLFSSDGHSENQLARKTIRIAILYIFVKLFYLGLDCILCAAGYIPYDGGMVDEWAREPWGHVLYNFIFFGDSTSHVWFVGSLALIYAGHWLLHHFHVDFKYLIPLSLVLIGVNYVTGEILPYCNVTDVFGMSISDFAAGSYVTIGLFFFQLGYYMHKYKEPIDERLSTPKLAAIAVASLALTLIEIIGINSTHIYDVGASDSPNVFVGTTIFAFALFLLTFRLRDDQLRCRPLEWMGKNILPWAYAYIGFGVYIMKRVVLLGYEDDFLIYQVLGPIISIEIQVLSAFAMYFLLVLIFGKKKKKRPEAEKV